MKSALRTAFIRDSVDFLLDRVEMKTGKASGKPFTKLLRNIRRIGATLIFRNSKDFHSLHVILGFFCGKVVVGTVEILRHDAEFCVSAEELDLTRSVEYSLSESGNKFFIICTTS